MRERWVHCGRWGMLVALQLLQLLQLLQQVPVEPRTKR
jgi:hypothetical protein